MGGTANTIQQACLEVKGYLVDDRYRIRLRDMVVLEANNLCSLLSSNHSSLLGNTLSQQEQNMHVGSYAAHTERLQYLLATGCFWGEIKHQHVWINCLERVAHQVEEDINRLLLTSRSRHWMQGAEEKLDWIELLAPYSSIILLYVAAIAFIEANQYNALFSLLTKAKVTIKNTEKPIIFILERWKPFIGIQKQDKSVERFPATHLIYRFLREPFKEFIFDGGKYRKSFDRVEYLLALVFADLYEKENGSIIGLISHWARLFPPPYDRFFPNESNSESVVVSEFEREIELMGNSWPPLQAGLFNGSVERVKLIKNRYDEKARDESKRDYMRAYYNHNYD